MDLDSFLEELGGGGTIHSAGAVFSLDPTRALEKMQDFALADPETYFQHVVASAVAGGATFVHVRTHPSSVSFRYDGRPLTPTAMHDLFASLFVSPRDPDRAFLRELAVGLCGARRLELGHVTVESWSGTEGARLSLTDGRADIEWLAGGGETREEVTEVLLRAPPTGRALVRALQSFLTSSQPASPWGSLRWAPAAIRVDGRPIASHPDDLVALYRLQGGEPMAEVPAACVLEGRHPEAYSALVMVTGEENAVTELTVVVHGMVRGTFPVQFGYPGIRVAAYAAHLTLDASRSSVVQDEVLEALKERLRAQVHRAVLSLAGSVRSGQVPAIRQMIAWRMRAEGVPLDRNRWLSWLRQARLFCRHGRAEHVLEPVTVGELVDRTRAGAQIPVARDFLPGAVQWHPLLDSLLPPGFQVDPDPEMLARTPMPRTSVLGWLASVPLRRLEGEVGLPGGPLLHRVQSHMTLWDHRSPWRWHDEVWEGVGLPPGLDIQARGFGTSPEIVVEAVREVLPELYGALAELAPHPVTRQLVTAHLLDYLAFCLESGTLGPHVTRLAEAALFSAADGGVVSLRRLGTEPGWTWAGPMDEPSAPGRSDEIGRGVYLTPWEANMVRVLLGTRAPLRLLHPVPRPEGLRD
ncbi:MAG: hypothetical protein HY319_13220 [Armatimonadetes bacterium]|nr:hypothetical protein [Armatimonadota bacterium]